MDRLLHGVVAGPLTRRRVLIVDDHPFFAACLRTLLDNESDLVVCGYAATSAELGPRIERLRPDLLVIDLSLGAESGLELGRHLRALQITTPILFTSTVRELTRAELDGVPRSGFIAKTQKPAAFLAALRAILDQDLAAPAPGEDPALAFAPTGGKI